MFSSIGIRNDNLMAAQVWAKFLSGSFAGVSATLSTYPLDVARTRITGRLAVGSGAEVASRGLLGTLRNMAKREGFGSWYRGVTPTLFGALPYEGIKFSVFDVLKELIPPEQRDTGSGSLLRLVCGACAGSAAGMVMYPNDTVRRLMQMQGLDGAPRVYKSTLDCWATVMREHGVWRFYRGAGPYLARLAPNAAIQFGTYEALKKWLDSQ